jgi:hypothetical protein
MCVYVEHFKDALYVRNQFTSSVAFFPPLFCAHTICVSLSVHRPPLLPSCCCILYTNRDTTELQLISTAPGAKVLQHIASNPLSNINSVEFHPNTWEPQIVSSAAFYFAVYAFRHVLTSVMLLCSSKKSILGTHCNVWY